MPKCALCAKKVTSGLVVEPECLNELLAKAEKKAYICPTCGNEEHPPEARFCIICGKSLH